MAATEEDENTQPDQPSTTEVVKVGAFDPALVRPWQYHNRAGSGMDDESLDALAASIRRDGQ